MTEWNLRTQSLSLNEPKVMGILNVTPDSFSDGGRYLQYDEAIRRAHEMVAAGADIIDIGAESTRPGAENLSPETEWNRLDKILKTLCRDLSVPISVDTRHGKVAAEALSYGVEIINDVSGGQDPELLDCVSTSGATYVLMHMRGNPQNMANLTDYDSLVPTIISELQERLTLAESREISRKKIAIDPGFGFAKTPKQNYELLKALNDLKIFRLPILVGLSRKRMIREIVGSEADKVTAASVVAAMLAHEKGASILRVHDVKETKTVLQMITSK